MSKTYEQLEPVISALDDRIKTNLGAFPTDTAEGSIASFPDGANNIPLKSLVVNIDPVQDLHGYDSPWVAGGGRNLLKPVETTVTSNGIIATGYEDGKVTVTGTATSDVQVELFLVSIAERRYSLILKDDISGSADTWWVSVSGAAPIYSGHVNSANFYSAGNYKLRINVKSGITINQTFYPMVAKSETTYVPYENICPISGWTGMQLNANGTTIPISWQSEAGTVYGGTLDVTNGVLTTYPYYASYNGETLTGAWISDRDVYAVGTAPTIGAQVVNIGAQGTEIQLSPHEVKSLLGQNNIFADTGDSAVEYRADTKLYIERLTEPDADMIADSNIVSGQYFMVGNSLYLATANIASGSAVIVGTNCTQKSLATALNEINQ